MTNFLQPVSPAWLGYHAYVHRYIVAPEFLVLIFLLGFFAGFAIFKILTKK